MAIEIVRSLKRPVCLPNADHVIIFEGDFLLSLQKLFVHMQVIHLYDVNTCHALELRIDMELNNPRV